MHRIVTHSGQAHADDIMAIALIIIKEGWALTDVEIVRINDGKAADFEDAEFVVDVGREHDSKMGWFDHHQLPSDAPPKCAFTLVADYYGIERAKMPWIDRLELLDSKGPNAWFRSVYGRAPKGNKELNEALGTIDVFSWFTRVANRGHENQSAFRDAISLATRWLGMELEYHDRRDENFAYAKGNLEIIKMDGFSIAFFKQRAMRGINDVLDGLTENDPSVIVTGKLDDRGDGYSAMRLNDDLRVDFLRRKGEEGCVFAHENGFCLKWSNDWDGYLDAVKRSVTLKGEP